MTAPAAACESTSSLVPVSVGQAPPSSGARGSCRPLTRSSLTNPLLVDERGDQATRLPRSSAHLKHRRSLKPGNFACSDYRESYQDEP
jgi:hypothetical protein